MTAYVTRLPILAALALIRIWQWVISPVLGPNCRFEPSCSAYAGEAITRHGLIRGAGLAVWRILRCNPWGGCGHDPVPGRDNDLHQFHQADTARPQGR